MRRMYLLSAFILPALLMGVSLIAPTPQAPPPPDLPHPDGVFSPAYVEADRLLEASWLPGNAGQKEALLLKAAERFTEAIHEAPDNASAYVNRGNIYAQLGQYDLAIADYNAALRITPWAGSADVIKNRGLVYEEQGQLCEALADFETFLSMIRDAPTERRASERVQFAAKVQVLRSQLSASEEQSLCPPQTSQSSLQSASEPETWVWADWYGQAKTYNDTIGGQVIPNIQGWMCEVAPGHWGHTRENVVWFQLPGTTASRTAYKYVTGPWTGWSQVSWEHYYASAMGWEAYPPNNYFLLVPDRDICTGYNAPANWHKIHGQYWVN
jgi:tetratricopeptide (TPR) repeat protein